MSRPLACLFAFLATALLSTACNPNGSGPLLPTQANAHGLSAYSASYSVQLTDEWGRPLPTYHHAGSAWVEGTWNQRYNVVVHNRSPERVEVVVTVDGRDVLTGELGDYQRQRGYVIDPYGSVTIDGFRTSLSDVAAFRFTDPGDSYSARMGSPQHLGVIGVAVFREVAPPPPPPVAVWGPAEDRAGGGEREEARAAEPSAPMGGADAPAPAQKQSNIGTRFGEQRYSPVTQTEFRRASDQPTTVMAVYYDDRAGLTQRGIIPSYQSPPPPAPDPFPHSPRFAPPPPG